MHFFLVSVLPALLVLITNAGQNRSLGKRIGKHANTLSMVTSALSQIFTAANAQAQNMASANSALVKPPHE